MYKKYIKYVDDVWNSGQQNFLSKEQRREKFKLIHPEEGEREKLINKISGKWCHLLENDSDITYLGQWIDFLC